MLFGKSAESDFIRQSIPFLGRSLCLCEANRNVVRGLTL